MTRPTIKELVETQGGHKVIMSEIAYRRMDKNPKLSRYDAVKGVLIDMRNPDGYSDAVRAEVLEVIKFIQEGLK